jgi:hypothetical protein
MKTLKEHLEFVEYLKEDENIFEMATLHPNEHKFGVNVKIHILQPGDKRLPHGPRLKIFSQKDVVFIITLPKDVRDIRVIGDTAKLKPKDVEILLDVASFYKEAFVTFWCNPLMSVSELMLFIKSINVNNFKNISKLRKEHPITCY